MFWPLYRGGLCWGVHKTVHLGPGLYNYRSWSWSSLVVPLHIYVQYMYVTHLRFDWSFLVSIELQRTQTEFEDSFIVKMYIFQFLNFYTSLFYIAFFKGKWVTLFFFAFYNYVYPSLQYFGLPWQLQPSRRDSSWWVCHIRMFIGAHYSTGHYFPGQTDSQQRGGDRCTVSRLCVWVWVWVWVCG